MYTLTIIRQMLSAVDYLHRKETHTLSIIRQILFAACYFPRWETLTCIAHYEILSAVDYLHRIIYTLTIIRQTLSVVVYLHRYIYLHILTIIRQILSDMSDVDYLHKNTCIPWPSAVVYLHKVEVADTTYKLRCYLHYLQFNSIQLHVVLKQSLRPWSWNGGIQCLVMYTCIAIVIIIYSLADYINFDQWLITTMVHYLSYAVLLRDTFSLPVGDISQCCPHISTPPTNWFKVCFIWMTMNINAPCRVCLTNPPDDTV